MLLDKQLIEDKNKSLLAAHKRSFEFTAEGVANLDEVLQKLIAFQIAIPSWALGTGGTRFGRFSIGGEPRQLEEKIEDVGLIHALNRSSGAISRRGYLRYRLQEPYRRADRISDSGNTAVWR